VEDGGGRVVAQAPLRTVVAGDAASVVALAVAVLRREGRTRGILETKERQVIYTYTIEKTFIYNTNTSTIKEAANLVVHKRQPHTQGYGINSTVPVHYSAHHLRTTRDDQARTTDRCLSGCDLTNHENLGQRVNQSALPSRPTTLRYQSEEQNEPDAHSAIDMYHLSLQFSFFILLSLTTLIGVCLSLLLRLANYFAPKITLKMNNKESELSYLIQYTSGAARQDIENCVIYLADVGYEKAKEILHKNFAQKHNIVQAFVEKVVRGPQIKSGEHLVDFVEKVSTFGTQHAETQTGGDNSNDLNPPESTASSEKDHSEEETKVNAQDKKRHGLEVELKVQALKERSIPEVDDIGHWSHLNDIEFPKLNDKEVSILIGSDVPEVHWTLEERWGGPKEPVAVRTILGWTLFGPIGSGTSMEGNINFIMIGVYSLLNQFSTWTKLEALIACFLRFKTFILAMLKTSRSRNMTCGPLRVYKLHHSTHEIVRLVQELTFPKELELIQTGIGDSLGKVLGEPLTPNKLLLLCPNPCYQPIEFGETTLYNKKWKQVQYLASIFWKCWIKEYLPTLQERQKWLHPRRNVVPGDFVLVMQENVQRGQWPKVIVEEVFPDEYGHVLHDYDVTWGNCVC
ncbi:Hypothetical predicted protein, partial [Paramuricea clavata]